jgi:nitrogen fixation/metabolism regulation signal transduction histidine kinase
MLEEHLTDTPLTIKKELKKTNDKIDELVKEFNDMNEKCQLKRTRLQLQKQV